MRSLPALMALSALTMAERNYDTMEWVAPGRPAIIVAKPKRKPKYKGSKAAKKANRKHRP